MGQGENCTPLVSLFCERRGPKRSVVGLGDKLIVNRSPVDYHSATFVRYDLCVELHKNARWVQVYLWHNANGWDQSRLVIALERANKLCSITFRESRSAGRLAVWFLRLLFLERSGSFRFIHPVEILDKLVHLGWVWLSSDSVFRFPSRETFNNGIINNTEQRRRGSIK